MACFLLLPGTQIGCCIFFTAIVALNPGKSMVLAVDWLYLYADFDTVVLCGLQLVWWRLDLVEHVYIDLGGLGRSVFDHSSIGNLLRGIE